MRYREGELPGTLGTPVGDGMTVVTAAFGLFTGIAFIAGGIYGRQRWLIFWGVTTVLASGAYLIAAALGYT